MIDRPADSTIDWPVTAQEQPEVAKEGKQIQEMQMWITIALVSGGVALVALGLARILPASGRP